MVVRGLHYFRPGPPVLHIYAEALIRLGTLRTIMQTVMTNVLPAIGLGRAPNLVVQVIMVVLIGLRGTVSRPETTKAR